MATLGAHKKHKVTIVGSGNWYVVVRLVLFYSCSHKPSMCY